MYAPYDLWTNDKESDVPPFAYALVDAFTVWLWESQPELLKGSPKYQRKEILTCHGKTMTDQENRGTYIVTYCNIVHRLN